MSNRIELEASYHLNDDYNDVLEKIKEEGFIKTEEITEEDTYYTDKDLTFIDNRTCLRTRKTNEDFGRRKRKHWTVNRKGEWEFTKVGKSFWKPFIKNKKNGECN